MTIETKSGIKSVDLTVERGKVCYITVDMGKAVLTPSEIPVKAEGETFIARKVEVDGREYEMTCVSMGNPHAVVFMDDIDSLDLEKMGPFFENHPLFPDRINTEFVQIIDEHKIKMRVWERGSSETISCGTGTCASVVASVLNGYCKKEEEIEVQIRGGKLYDTYKEDGTVIMKGPAVHVFDGEIEITNK